MLALFSLSGAILVWIFGVIAGFKLWGGAYGILIAIGLTVLFWQTILMALVLAVAVFAMSRTQT